MCSQIRVSDKAMIPCFRAHIRNLPPLTRLCCVLIMAVCAGVSGMSVAQAQSDGANLPRFVSTRSQPVNVRIGPGTRYDLAWKFTKAGMPVEIIQEFDVWRKVRYFDGDEGWIHVNLLTSDRTALVRPWEENGQAALYARASDDAAVRAWLPTRFMVRVRECSDGWCEVTATGPDLEGEERSFSGHMVQFDLWGVYPDETID